MPPKKTKRNQYTVKDYCRKKAENWLFEQGIIDKQDISPEADRLVKSLAARFRKVWDDAGRDRYKVYKE